MNAGDAEAVARLTSQLGYERTAERIGAWIMAAAARPGEQAAFVACADGEVVGWIEVSVERRLQSEPFAMIGGLVVREGERGRGTGRRLCQAAENWAWERGLRTVRVTSRSTREDAHRFYLRDGYEVVKTSLVFEKRRPD
ncbi:MAG TPA: GNAT family N-acetyltransferase [Terracidiphilus sp.]|jgi:GNAT superfamily N-acetyltransferase|nr:GNAT family N-acetyltransferase [Terracidiphilus sp.]